MRFYVNSLSHTNELCTQLYLSRDGDGVIVFDMDSCCEGMDDRDGAMIGWQHWDNHC